MMSEHLSIVLPPLLEVDSQKLLEIESQLNHVVPLERSRHLSGGPIGP